MALEAARRYLERVVTWDGQSYNGIFYKFLPPGAEKPIIPGNAFKTVDEAVAHLAQKRKWGGDTDIWLSMASQPNVSEKKSNAVRFQNTASHIKSLFIDLDVKPGKPDKGYETTEEALAAFDAFVEWCGLPAPNVKVLSGTGGAHVYWTLDTPLTPAEWQPWALALAAAAIAFGLKFDSQCTVDVVRLLRVPETFNGKQSPRLPVVATLIADWDYSLDHLRPALEPFLGRLASTVAGAVTPVGNVNDELSGGIEARTAAPRDIDIVGAKCGFVANTLATAGASHSNPLWYLSLAVAIYCADGEAVAHRLSSGHPGYNHAETQQEYERVKKDHADRASLGFPSCAAIEAAGCSDCAACPLKGHIKSPLNIVAAPVAAAPAPSMTGVNVPAPYFFNPLDNRIYAATEDGAQSQMVLDFHIRQAWSSNNPLTLHFEMQNAFGRWLPCRIPAVAMSGPAKLHEAFSDCEMSVAVTDKVRQFMVSFLAHLQKSKAAIMDATPFGWTETDGTVDGFAYNSTRFTDKGDFPSSQADPKIAELWTPQGDITPWRDLVAMINNQKRPDLEAILATAFAAPLMKFSGERGAVIGAWSAASGVGKSGALETAQAVWGNPARGKSGLSDTDNATFVRAGALKNLPMYWDEIRGRSADKATEKFGAIIFQLAEGREKARATQSAALAKQREWQTLLTYAANTSMAEHITEGDKTSPAGAMRVFEFEVKAAAHATFDSNFSRLKARIADNYGHAGLEYARFLGANVQAVNNDVMAMITWLKKKLLSPPDERFWIVSMATILVGAKYANKLGLANFDLAALKTFLFTEYTRMSSHKAGAANDLSTPDNSLAILAQFLTDKRAVNTLFTNKISRTSGRQVPGVIKLWDEGPQKERIGAIEVQIGVEDRAVRISMQALSTWLRKNDYTTTQPILDAWEKFFGMVAQQKAALGAGTTMPSGSMRCIEFSGIGYPDIDDAIGRFK